MADYKNEVQVNTQMITLWDKDSKQLRISAMDSGVSVSIWVPAFSADGAKTYPANNRHTCVVQQKNLGALAYAIKNDIIEAYGAGKNMVRALYTNAARSTMIEVELRDGDFYLNIHRNCDAETRLPDSSITFKFDTTPVIDKFDRETGQLTTTPVHGDFYIFSKTIINFTEQGAGSIAGHGIRNANKFSYKKDNDKIDAIATAVNAKVPTTTYGSNNSYSSGGNNTSYDARNSEYTQPDNVSVGDLMDVL